MPRLRATPRPRDFQHPHDPIRLLAQAAQPKLRKELREAFRHLRTIVPVSSLAGAIRRGTPRQAAAALIDHWSEVLKGVFNRLGDIRFDASDLGARKIMADFKRAGRRVRYRKAFNPDQPRDDHGRWEGSSRSEARRNLAEASAHANRLTERWRNMVRGEERRQEQRMRERMARDAPARAERRLLSSLPGAKFDGAGNLTNIEEMRAVRAERDRRRQANKSIDALFDELSSPTAPRERQFIKAIGDGFDFDRFDEDTIDALRQAQDDLIADLSDQARDTVAYLIDRGVQAGDSADEIATSIRDTIALTERQAQAVANYRSLLEGLDQQALERELRNAEFDDAVQAAIDSGEVLSDSMIDDMVAEYADNYLDYRADTIARTESLRSANEGLRDSYRQAADRGVFPAEAVTRFWRLDGKPCPICVQIWENNQDGVGLDEDFQSDDGPVDDAPVHGSCMCLIEYVTNLDMLPEEESAEEDQAA